MYGLNMKILAKTSEQINVCMLDSSSSRFNVQISMKANVHLNLCYTFDFIEIKVEQ